MKNTLTRKALSFFLAALMVFGVASTGLIVVARGDDNTINYVSIGDSMTNGYGFVGYEQGNNTDGEYDFLNDKGIYGEGSYALQFENYLAEKFNATVNHTKLAPSGLLADDLLYLLGAREEEFDDDWAGYRHYVGTYDEPANIDKLKEHFQTAITEADIMTMCIGNASFGAYLVQQVTDAIGIMGSNPDVDEQLTLENGLALLDDEAAKKIVLDIYADMKEYAMAYVADIELLDNFDMEVILDIVAYTVASFLVSYEDVLDTIIEMNPDVEIILIGLMNTTYGMVVTGEGFEFPFGDMMDDVFGALNAYIAAIPALKKAAGEYKEATFYYAEQPAPDFIVHAFDDLAANDWANIDDGRLSGKIVRQRNVDAYNNTLRYAIGSALGFDLPEITLDDLNSGNYVIGDEPIITVFPPEWGMPDAYDSYGDYSQGQPSQEFINKYISVAIYLAIEEAVVANVDTMNITVDGLMGIATDIFGALGEMPDAIDPSNSPGPWTIKTTLVNWFNGSENGRAMCKVYALFKVGDGMSVHPTPTGHDNIFKAVVEAYENKYTVGDHMNSLAKPYVDATIKYFEDLAFELYGIVEGHFFYLVNELEDDVAKLYEDLNDATNALNDKLAELTEKQEVILEGMLAEREAIAAELEALEEELAGIYAAPVSANGITKKMTATTVADTAEELEAELEAAIAETKAALDALDAEILAVKNQIETDKSGIEAIQAAIETIKANIAETEAALAEVNAAMNKLVADLDALGINLELLKKVAAGVKVDPEEVYEAVKAFLENLPETIETIENLYDAAVEAIENAKAAVEAIKASAETIKTNVENLIDSAKDLAELEGEKIAAIEATAKEIYDLAEDFVKANLPTVENALNDTAADVEDVIKREIEKAKALWAEYDEVVMAALYIAYTYCENKGYIQLAEDFVKEHIECVETKLDELEKYIDELDLEELENLDIEEILEKLAEEYGIELDIEIDTTAAEVVIAKINAYIECVKAEIAKAKACLEELKANVELITSDVEAVCDALANLKDALCNLGNSICDLKAAVKDEVLTLVGYANQIGEKVLGVIDTLDVYADLFVDGVVIIKNEIIEAIEEAIYNATHADYVRDGDSYYVAFGDGTAVSESYVDLLAKELGVKYKNLAKAFLDEDEKDMFDIEDMFDIIDANVAEIKKADLITIGFGNGAFITEAVNNALEYKKDPTFDWAKYVGEDGAKYVAEALAELKAMLDEEDFEDIMGMPASELAVIAIESYAYSCVAYAVNLPIVANEISEINPEALVILVGMYNPLDGVVIDLGDVRIDVSDYLTYLAKAAGLESLIYSIVTGDSIYVDAPNVETKLADDELNLSDLIYEFLMEQGENFDPSAAGHEYIKNQILGALNVTEAALLGDANNDGEVNSIDAMYILQYDVELIGEGEINLELADVNGDGKVNSIDAMYILRYDAELIEKFPAEDKAA